MSGTGKSTTTRLLEEELGYTIIYFGGVVLKEVERRGLPPGQISERAVRESLRQEHGMAAMAVACFDHIQHLLKEGKKVAIDGLYSGEEYEYLRERLRDQFSLIAIHADKHLRYERLATRAIRPLTPEEVDVRDRTEIGQLDKATPIVLAQYHALNNTSVEELDKEVKKIVHTIESRY